MKQLLILSIGLFVVRCMFGMDEELPRHTEGFIKASDQRFVKAPLAIIAVLTALEKRDPYHESELYAVPATSYCAAQTLKEIVCYLKKPKRIESIATKHELQGLSRALKKLGGPSTTIATCKSLSKQHKVNEIHLSSSGNCLNMTGCNVQSCLGLERWKGDTIKHLILNNNQIKRFDLRELLCLFPQLSRLDIAYNKIEKFRTSMVKGMPSCFLLNLSDNPVRCGDANVLNVLKKLRDRNMLIWIYNTKLSEEELTSFAEIVGGKSVLRRSKEIVLLGGSVLLWLGGATCGIARGILSADENLSLPKNILLMAGVVVGTIGSAISIGVSSLVKEISPKEQQPSKLFWGNYVD